MRKSALSPKTRSLGLTRRPGLKYGGGGGEGGIRERRKFRKTKDGVLNFYRRSESAEARKRRVDTVRRAQNDFQDGATRPRSKSARRARPTSRRAGGYPSPRSAPRQTGQTRSNLGEPVKRGRRAAGAHPPRVRHPLRPLVVRVPFACRYRRA